MKAILGEAWAVTYEYSWRFNQQNSGIWDTYATILAVFLSWLAYMLRKNVFHCDYIAS
jgi:hypothetical protein